MLRRHDRALTLSTLSRLGGLGCCRHKGPHQDAPTLAVAAGPSAHPPYSGSLVPGGSGRYAENAPSSFTLITFLISELSGTGQVQVRCPGRARAQDAMCGQLWRVCPMELRVGQADAGKAKVTK